MLEIQLSGENGRSHTLSLVHQASNDRRGEAKNTVATRHRVSNQSFKNDTVGQGLDFDARELQRR
jgi:hypothetical protein